MAELDLRGINLRNDLVFKYVFASADSESILISLINAVLGLSKRRLITSINYLNPFNIRETKYEKSTVLDIRATDTNGRQYNIEMQVKNESHFINRIIYYHSQLTVGQLKEGESYGDMRKTISIAFTDFKLFPRNKNYHNKYMLLNVEDRTKLSGLVEYHFLELPKFEAGKGLDSTINKWLFAIKNGEEFINEPEKIPATIKKEATIMRAIEKMQQASTDKKFRAILEYRRKADLDVLNRIKSAQMLGKQEGDEKAREAIALTMLGMGMSFEVVSKATKLSVEQILKIKK
jgi:predicted transposase/invertase (TIGR01784 family)